MKITLLSLGIGRGSTANISLSNVKVPRLNRSATYSIRSTGEVYGIGFQEYWIDVPSLAGNYEVRATKTSGDDLLSGVLNAWSNLGSNREWKSDGYTVLLVEIREIVTGVIKASATITLERVGYDGGTL